MRKPFVILLAAAATLSLAACGKPDSKSADNMEGGSGVKPKVGGESPEKPPPKQDGVKGIEPKSGGESPEKPPIK